MILNTKGYKIRTPYGYETFEGIQKVHKDFWYKIVLEDGTVLGTSDNHRVLTELGIWKEAKDLQVGDLVLLQVCGSRVKSVQKINEPIDLYDICGVRGYEGGHMYLTNKVISHNCDANFLTSGDTFFEIEDMAFYEETYQQEPIERRGIDGNFWIWEYPDYTKTYLVSADVARGDGGDFSVCEIWDVENCVQVAEYRGQPTPRDFGATLCGIATEYNNALLVCENANVGYSTIEEIIARGYPNLYYGDNSNLLVETAEQYAAKSDSGRLTPGFTTSMKTRPLLLAKFYDYIHQKSVIIHSKRLLNEMRTFVWKNAKAQAAEGYHDDTVMAAGIGLFVRDTALRLRQQGLDLSRAQMSSFANLNKRNSPVVQISYVQDPYKVQNCYGQQEDIRWLLG